jgi:hypothetical protein
MYQGHIFDVWDWFNNITPGMPEVVFSNSASRAIIDQMGNLSINNKPEPTRTDLVSSFAPK